MKKSGFAFFAVSLFLVSVLTAGQALAVDVYGEGAYTATDVQVCIYADIDGTEALRSFGVKLVYNGTDLSFDETKSKRNEDVWFLGNGTNNYTYSPLEDVEDGTNRAVIIIGGKLDTTNTGAQVSGDRVLLGTVWFTRNSGTGPLTNPLTLGLGKPDPYANFVVGPNAADVLDNTTSLTLSNVNIFERGDANADGIVDSRDIRTLRTIIGTPNVPCWADCNGDGVLEPVVDSRDIKCLRMK